MTCTAVPEQGLHPVQAGVALGLAKTLAIRFPTWGPDFASLMVSTWPLPQYAVCSPTTSIMCQHHTAAAGTLLQGAPASQPKEHLDLFVLVPADGGACMNSGIQFRNSVGLAFARQP